MSSIRLQVPPAESHDHPPLLAFFPSGAVPAGLVEGQGGEKKASNGGSRFRVDVLEGGGGRRTRHALVVRDEDVAYVGQSHASNGTSNERMGTLLEDTCQYAVAVLRKSSGQMQLFPITANKALRMEVRVDSVDYTTSFKPEGQEHEAAAAAPAAANGVSVPASRSRDLLLLSQEFGSKASRVQSKAIDESIRMRRQASEAQSSEVNNLLRSAAESSHLAAAMSADEAAELAVERSIPPFVADAETPEAIFPLDRLIPPDDWRTLDPSSILRAAVAASGASGGKEKQQQQQQQRSFAFAVTDRLIRLQTAESQDDKIRIARMLLYLHYLICFHRANPSLSSKRTRGESLPDIAVAADNYGIPTHTMQRFVTLFSDVEETAGGGMRYCRPRKKAALLLSYILVLALHLDSFESDPDSLTTDLSMSLKPLLLAYKEIGCKVEKVKSSKVGGPLLEGGDGLGKDHVFYRATLVAPLRFPKIKIGRARK